MQITCGVRDKKLLLIYQKKLYYTSNAWNITVLILRRQSIYIVDHNAGMQRTIRALFFLFFILKVVGAYWIKAQLLDPNSLEKL